MAACPEVFPNAGLRQRPQLLQESYPSRGLSAVGRTTHDTLTSTAAWIAPARAATAARGIEAGSATSATVLRTRSGPGSATMTRSAGAGRTSGGAEVDTAVITAPAFVALPATTAEATTAAAPTGATTTAAMGRGSTDFLP